jgi:F0F1-type ATP synthase assembly protein I
MTIAIVRWILVLPAAIAASFLVQIINAILGYFIPDVAIQWWNSWAGTFVFILAGCYVAPRYKFIVSIALAVLVGMFIGIAIVQGSEGFYKDTPFWNLIVCCVITFVGAVMSCLIVKGMEIQKAKGKIEAELMKQSDGQQN